MMLNCLRRYAFGAWSYRCADGALACRDAGDLRREHGHDCDFTRCGHDPSFGGADA
jgi:hypothetical protein